MFRKPAIAGIARQATLVVFAVPTVCLAAGGTLQFQGVITESACAVSAAQAGFSQAMLRRLSTARGATSIEGGTMYLTMRCNASQSVNLSFQSKVSAGTEPGAAAVDVVLRRAGRDLLPSDSISLALAGKKDNLIEIDTALRKMASSDAGAVDRMDGAILVSVNYR